MKNVIKTSFDGKYYFYKSQTVHNDSEPDQMYYNADDSPPRTGLAVGGATTHYEGKRKRIAALERDRCTRLRVHWPDGTRTGGCVVHQTTSTASRSPLFYPIADLSHIQNLIF